MVELVIENPLPAFAIVVTREGKDTLVRSGMFAVLNCAQCIRLGRFNVVKEANAGVKFPATSVKRGKLNVVKRGRFGVKLKSSRRLGRERLVNEQVRF